MLQDQITADMKTALKASDKITLDTLRYLLAEIKNITIDTGELSDTDIQKIIRRQIKQIEETLPQYQAAGRTDQVQTDKAKIAVLTAYLPAQLSDSELEELINQAIVQTDAPSIKTVMPQVMKIVAGRADGSRVSQAVNQALAAR